MTMARIKNNVKVKIDVRPKKGLNPNPSLQVSKEELDRFIKELLLKKAKECCVDK